MNKFFTTLIILLVCYIIFFDLKHGTLPASKENPEPVPKITERSLPYFDHKVIAGDTVLTVIEKQLNKQIPVSIEEIVRDFSKLNKGISPEKIQIDKTYHFPDYSKR